VETPWPQPVAGDIVWCRFPDGLSSRTKPRPTLVLKVFDDVAPLYSVQVGYGTSQKTTTLHGGEFLISKSLHPAAYEMAGLSYDTKFNLRQTLILPFTDQWFGIPPSQPHGAKPKLGTLHPSLMRAAAAAYRAANP
jgi:hypothetical protein